LGLREIVPQPDFASARIDPEKIADYLLGNSSFAAVAKARFFSGVGFRASEWQRFAQALRTQAAGAAVAEERSPWGRKYVALGPIDAPNGRRYKIVSVWIDDGTGLRLVTAYPAKD
jgi:hypothetical protein